MDLKRRYRFIIAFLSLFIFISLLQDTYAKYMTKAEADTNISVARWSILINSLDVINNNDFSNAIEPVFPGTSHIASGIIAPLSEGYFDLVIDFSSVDVSFDQKINLELGEDNTIRDLIFTKYTINGGTDIELNANVAEIDSTTLLTEQTRVKTYRIYVKWLDGEGATMDNQEDTEATKNGKASVKVNISFTQKPE